MFKYISNTSASSSHPNDKRIPLKLIISDYITIKNCVWRWWLVKYTLVECNFRFS